MDISLVYIFGTVIIESGTVTIAEYYILEMEMEMFQHDGGVKSLKIKQQRDGTESVIWNLARFSSTFVKKN